MSRRCRNIRGFTLLEILVGLALLALLITLIQGIYAGTTKSREISRAETIATHTVAATVGRMADEFAMTFQTDTRISYDQFYLDTDSDDNSTVEFSTRTARIGNIRIGGDTRVRYELERDEESEAETPRYRLIRSEMADPFGDINREGVSYEMLDDVTRFTINVWDETLEDWVENWQYLGGAGVVPDLPLAVRIELAWGEEEVERLIRTATPVYRRR